MNEPPTTMGSLLSKMLNPGEPSQIADKLFARLVAQARQPDFFRELGVPDTMDGRFEMIALHAFLIFQRLKGQGDKAAAVAQMLYDNLIKDMEASLRQLGVGDAGVGKRVRALTEALHGRIKAYETALGGSQIDMEGALRRNLYGTIDPDMDTVRAVGNYLRRAKESADTQPIDRVLRGLFDFPPLPTGFGNKSANDFRFD